MSEIDPARLRPHYRRFLDDDRILLTGHSHQAWPDVAREGLVAAFDDAAALVDGKWDNASRAADAVRDAVALQWNVASDEIALGGSTHELVSRFLSALDLRRRPRVVTTDGEFHSMHRQLSRMQEEGLEVTWVSAHPVASLSERLATAIDERCAALMCSTVLFETATIVPDLASAIHAAHDAGAEVLLDAYHQFNVVPLDVGALAGPVFVTAGGYKYAQWGEGCCFLRVPPKSTLRPVNTGWFADFAHLAEARDGRPVGYGPRGADLFAGSTYDPSSHYRARAVIAFFHEQGLSVDALRACSLRQTQRLMDGLGGWDLATPARAEARGGFVSIRLPRAAELVRALRARNVFVDARGELLRLGPAPYTTDEEIDRALTHLHEVAER